MTPADLSALRALAEAATPGPWRSEQFGRTPPLIFADVASDAGDIACDLSLDDAALIVALRNAAPSLLAHVAAQAERIEALEGALKGLLADAGRFHYAPARHPVDSCLLCQGIETARRVLGGKEGT